MRTVVDELRDLGKKMGFPAWRMDGYDSARWIVLDCVHVVTHVFDVDSRDFYDLELLWGDCPRVDWRAELGLPAEIAAETTGRVADEVDNSGVAGDADIDEDAEIDEPVVMELPDESTGSNSVEFVEIDPPGRRKGRGRVVYPTPVEEPEDSTAEELAMSPIRGDALEEIEEEELMAKAGQGTRRKKAGSAAKKKPAKKAGKAAKAAKPKLAGKKAVKTTAAKSKKGKKRR